MQLCESAGSLLFVSSRSKVHRLAVNIIQLLFHLLFIFIGSEHALLSGRRESSATFLPEGVKSVGWLLNCSARRYLWNTIIIISWEISFPGFLFLIRNHVLLTVHLVRGIRRPLRVILQMVRNAFIGQWLFGLFRFIVLLLVPIFGHTLLWLLGEVPPLFLFVLRSPWILTRRVVAITKASRILFSET